VRPKAPAVEGDTVAETGRSADQVGRAGSDEEPRSLDQPQPAGGGWRQLATPLTVRCFLNNIWVDAPAIDVNDETREIRIQWPPLVDPATELVAHHEIIDASHYQPAAGLF
jgi:hypothetical protein